MSAQLISSANALNLKRLIWMRLIILSAEAAAAWVTITQWHIQMSMTAMIAIWFMMGLISIMTLVRLRFDWEVADNELFSQLLLEVLALTAVLYFSGGSTNPFAPFYLLPLTLTAVSLPGIHTWIMTGFTVGCYTLLLFYNIPLPAVHGGHGGDFRLHEMGMWFGFLFSAVLIASFAVRMASSVRHSERLIADMREQQLRQEQVLALGTLAAGAAHELGTPLSTMAVVLKDMDPQQAVGEKKLQILRGQVERCKEILGSISAAAGEVRAESGYARAVDQCLLEITERWSAQRPDVRLQQRVHGTQPPPRVVFDQTLEQAIMNILNNAADASPEDVSLVAQWDEHALDIDVSDRGEGISTELVDLAGNAIQTTKQDGLGLGLFLSYTTLQRFGGHITLLQREGGGTRCHIHLPIARLRVSTDE